MHTFNRFVYDISIASATAAAAAAARRQCEQ